MIERADSFSPRQPDLVAYYFDRYRFVYGKRRKKLAAKPLKAFRAAIGEWNAEAISHQRGRDLHPEIAKHLYRKGAAVPVKKQPPKATERTWQEQAVAEELQSILRDGGLDPEALRRRIVVLVALEEMTPEQKAELAELTEKWKAAKRQAKKQARINREWALVDEVADASDVETELARILRRASGERPPKHLRRKESNR